MSILENKEKGKIVSPEEKFSSKPILESKKFILITVVILIVVIALGALSYYSKKEEPINGTNPPPQKEEEPKASSPATVPDVLHNLRGAIKEFDGGNIVMEAEIPQVDENGKLILLAEIKKVLITSDTKITSLSFVIHEPTGKKIPREEDIRFNDLQIGDYIEVLSGQNIRIEKEFEVSKVRILEE